MEGEPNPSIKVFGTVELLEAILLHVPLRDLIHTHLVNTSWRDTIAGSSKLSTTLGTRSSTGAVLGATTVPHLSRAVMEEDMEGINHDLACLNFEIRQELQPCKQYLPDTASIYLSYSQALKEKKHVACGAYLTAAFPGVSRAFKWPRHRTEIHFGHADGIPKWAYESDQTLWFERRMSSSKLASSFATQPPVSCIILEPANNYRSNSIFLKMRNGISRKLSERLIITNTTGVTIGDVEKAIQVAKAEITEILDRLEQDYRRVLKKRAWEYFETFRLKGARSAREMIYREEEIEYDDDGISVAEAVADSEEWLEDEEWKKEPDFPSHDQTYMAPDLLGTFFFKLLIPQTSNPI